VSVNKRRSVCSVICRFAYICKVADKVGADLSIISFPLLSPVLGWSSPKAPLTATSRKPGFARIINPLRSDCTRNVSTCYLHMLLLLPNAKHRRDNEPTCSQPQAQNCAIGASYRIMTAPSLPCEGSPGTGGKLR
jgi:hypothetical protein